METGTGGNRGEKWQSILTSPRDRLAYLRNTLHFSDLTITFPGHSKVMQAHRLLLAMNSPVFEAMLYGSLALAEGEVLKLPEDPPWAFHWILEYVYLGEVKLPDVQTALKVYQLASKYQMDNLVLQCAKYLKKSVTAEMIPTVYQMAVLINDKILLAACFKGLTLHTDAVLRSQHFPELSSFALGKLLAHPTLLPSSEVTVFHAIVKWGYEQLKREEVLTVSDSQETERQEKDQSKQELQLGEIHAHNEKDDSRDVESSGSNPEVLENISESTSNSRVLPENTVESTSDPLILPENAGESSTNIHELHEESNNDCSSSIIDLEFEEDPIMSSQNSNNMEDKTLTKEDPTDSHHKSSGDTKQPHSLNLPLRQVLAPFLPHIHFLKMTTNEFVEEVMPHDIFTSREARAILMNIKNVHILNPPPLPPVLMTTGHISRMKVVNAQLTANRRYQARNMIIVTKMEVSCKMFLKKVIAPNIVTHEDSVLCIKNKSGKLVGKGHWKDGTCEFKSLLRLGPSHHYEMILSKAFPPCKDCKCRLTSGSLVSNICKGIVYECMPITLELWCHHEPVAVGCHK
ncbi:hypothetical protein Pcinc_010033 [Petrolisthes cinctipes]|uniref:BTB domain-containing protein n=1 Tax=Petrolisthes cinctipes TaxID=88211 RepID=A0AAE1KVR6_PETCI|nr:hypothetical protein Pcinc_010033 [Petrolisthes cinctipes]